MPFVTGKLAAAAGLALATSALATSLLAAGCGGDAARADQPPHAAFRDAVHARDIAAIEALLADDIVFFTPVLDDPIVGRERVARLFHVLDQVFDEIRFVDEHGARDRAALVFAARVGEQPVEGVDLLGFDADGRIATFKVMVRPLAGMQALAAAVAPHLGEILE